jgi:hypothetical protein
LAGNVVKRLKKKRKMEEKWPKKSGMERLFLGYIAHFISHEKWSKMAVNSRRNETKDGAFNTKRTLCPKQPQQQQQQ